ncbi:hypothetical protein [Streptomyces chrestomyceticus]|uniref:hypothetical protein n=1 Tax=Streptomyces chrestomyceticus TaxID=68185 RepID=UPI0033F52861
MSKPEVPTSTVYSLSLKWPREQPKALPVNQFAISMGLPTSSGPDAIYLSVGHADPPFLSAAAEDVAAEAAGLDVLPIDVLGRYVFTRSRLGELIGLLQAAAEAYDQATGGEQDAGARDQP